MKLLYESGLIGSMEVQGRISEQIALFIQQMKDKKMAAEMQQA